MVSAGRRRLRGPERRDPQPPRAARRARARGAFAFAPTATPRSCSTSTAAMARGSSPSCAACSPSPCGIAANVACSWPATASASSPCTTRSTTAGSASPPSSRPSCRRPAFSREVDREALHAYLAFNSIPAPMTIFRAARKLSPGHLLTCTAGRGAHRALRAAGPGRRSPSCAARARRQLAEELRERMRESVQRPPARRRPRRRPALRRRRLLAARRPGRAGLKPAGDHVLDRLSRAVVQRA